MLHASDLLDLSHTLARPLFEKVTYPWQVLPEIGEFVRALGVKLSPDEYDSPAPLVWIHKSALVAPSASITGPCIVRRRRCATGVYTWKRPHRRRRRGGQFHGAEERHPL